MKKFSVVFALCIAVLLAGCADSGRSGQGGRNHGAWHD